MSDKPIRAAIIGCGAVTERFHAPALQAAARDLDLELCCVMDPDRARAAAIQTAWPAAVVATTLDEIPRDIDLALIASPAMFHASQACAMLARGCHVLCEKPMATSVAACEAMIEAANSAGRLLAVGHMRRFFPALQSIREIMATRRFGQAIRFHLIEGYRFQWAARSDSYFRKEIAGGGALLDLGIHALDLAEWWFGTPIAVDYADDAMGGIEANCHIALDYPNGVTGEVRISRDCDLANRFVVVFEHGWVAWNTGDPTSLDIGMDGTLGLAATVRRTNLAGRDPVLVEAQPHGDQSFLDQIVNVVSAIRGQGTLLVPGAEAIKSLRIVERCYATARLMDMPWMTAEETKRAERLR